MNKVINLSIVTVIAGFMTACGGSGGGGNSSSNGTNVLKTGQKTCYQYGSYSPEKCSKAFKGQDGYYQMGLKRRFVSHDPNDAEGVVEDKAKHLMWIDGLKEIIKGGSTLGYLAQQTCEELDYGGYSDWSTATRENLRWLRDYSRGAHEDSMLDNAFLSIDVNNWVYDKPLIDGKNHYLFSFRSDFYEIEEPKTRKKIKTLCVRTTKPREYYTGLEWQSDYTKKSNWEDAIKYCNELSEDGGRWRLPNINEIGTLTSCSGWPVYWSSTTVDRDPSMAYAFSGCENRSFAEAKNTSNFDVRCVRTYKEDE